MSISIKKFRDEGKTVIIVTIVDLPPTALLFFTQVVIRTIRLEVPKQYQATYFIRDSYPASCQPLAYESLKDCIESSKELLLNQQDNT